MQASRHWPERKLEKVRPDSRRTSSVRVGLPQGQQAVNHLAALAAQLLLLQQDIEGEDQADDKGADTADHTADEPTGGDNPGPNCLGDLQSLGRKLLPLDLLLQLHQLLLQ